jgi:predicted metal-dependent hydrolase
MTNKYPQKVIRSNRRTIALEVTPRAEVLVRAPLTTSDSDIAQYVARKQRWLLDKLTKVAQVLETTPKHQFREGESFLFQGQTYELLYTNDKAVELTDKLCVPKGKKEIVRDQIIEWYKQQARDILRERVDLMVAHAGAEYKKFRVTSAEKRWGSCGAKGSINLSWRLVMAPVWVIDYVVAHEVAHLDIRNHSAAFWNKVGILYPNYRKAQQWLSAKGSSLVL